jgi:flagellar hook-associated protein FlgK
MPRTRSIYSRNRDISTAQQYADNKSTTSVANINNYATQIAANLGTWWMISEPSRKGQQPNDLVRSADSLLDKISLL